MSAVVRTHALTKDFPVGFWRPRPHRALDDFTFEIRAGDIFGLLGPNGAGKSTAIKLLLDLLRPTSGHAELFGRAVSDAQTRRRLGFLPDQPAFYGHLTAEEQLAYFAGLFGATGADRRRRAGVALDRLGVGSADRRRPLHQYSKGMLQRVGLAQALVNDPDLVILDEPMSGLDPAGRREVRDLIVALRDEGRTVLFSSHVLADAEALCSRIGILSRGRLVTTGTVEALTACGTGRWEVVAAEMRPDLVARLRPRVRRLTSIAEGRFTLELGPDVRPEPFIAELAAHGASLVSAAPVRTSLEDVFSSAVGGKHP
jgi:ABC-2 type transport system ATP-binding protein